MHLFLQKRTAGVEKAFIFVMPGGGKESAGGDGWRRYGGGMEWMSDAEGQPGRAHPDPPSFLRRIAASL